MDQTSYFLVFFFVVDKREGLCAAGLHGPTSVTRTLASCFACTTHNLYHNLTFLNKAVITSVQWNE